jgi:hypothetical protein
MKETDDKITVYTIVLYFDYGSRNADVHGAGAVAFTDSYEEAQNLLRLEAEKEKQYLIDVCDFKPDEVEITKNGDDELVVYGDGDGDYGDYSHVYLCKGNLFGYKKTI